MELKPCPLCECHDIGCHIQVGALGVRGVIECKNPACGVLVRSPWSKSIATAEKRAAKIWNCRSGEYDKNALRNIADDLDKLAEDAEVSSMSGFGSSYYVGAYEAYSKASKMIKNAIGDSNEKFEI